VRHRLLFILLLVFSAGGCSWPERGALTNSEGVSEEHEEQDFESLGNDDDTTQEDPDDDSWNDDDTTSEDPDDDTTPEDPDDDTTPEDADGDGVGASEDCDDQDPLLGSQALDQDCDGVLTQSDCDDSDPSLLGLIEDPDCDGTPGSVCILCGQEDLDCDGVCVLEDCDDLNPFIPVMAEDADCDGFLTAFDCDDTDPSIHPGANDIGLDGIDQNCDGVDAIFLTPEQELAVDWVRTLLALDCASLQTAGASLTALAAPIPGDLCPLITTSTQTTTTPLLSESDSSTTYAGGCTDSTGTAVLGNIEVQDSWSLEDMAGPNGGATVTLDSWTLEALVFQRQSAVSSAVLALGEVDISMSTNASLAEHFGMNWITTDSCSWSTTGGTTLEAGTTGPWVDGTTNLDLLGTKLDIVDLNFIEALTSSRTVSGTASAVMPSVTWTAQINGASWWRYTNQEPGRTVHEGATNQPTSGQILLEITDSSSGNLLHSLDLTFGGCVDVIWYYEPWPFSPPTTFTPGPYGPAGCSGCAEVVVDGQPAVRQCGGWNL